MSLADFERMKVKSDVAFIKELCKRNNKNTLEVKENFKQIIEEEFDKFMTTHDNEFNLHVIAHYIDNYVDDLFNRRNNKTKGDK